MKEHEIFEKAERCVLGNCKDCPYTTEDCSNVLKNLLELAKRYKAQLEQPTTAGAECAVMPNYEEINRKLEDKLCKAEIEHERTQRDLYEAQRELAHLRAVKATAEAFLGRKIEVK
jgi:hypothetical protein